MCLTDGIEDAIVFSREELTEIANKPRHNLTAHPTTNTYMLFAYLIQNDCLQYVKEEDRLGIELDIHKHPEKYVNRWDKTEVT